jgi:hypothetical protein
MKNITYLSWITYALIISGYIVSLASSQASVVGYSCVVVGLFSLIVLQLVPLTRQPELSVSMFIPYIPIIVVLGITSWLLAINIKYSKQLQKGNVTNEYKTFNIINFILMLVQLVVLKMNTLEYKSSMVAFLASFQLIVVFIMQMNLEYFVTDG